MSLKKLKRAPDRGHYDEDTIHGVLDSTHLCHVGYQVDGQPIVTPTIHWREGNEIFWHGSRISRTLKESENTPVCVTVTHLDGLVFAKSAFHHSANYRSVMVFGVPRLVEDRAEKEKALIALIDKMTPNRWDSLRPMTEKEFAATGVLSLKLDEASAKIRTGGPNDLDSDVDYPVWAGVLPFSMVVENPIDAEHNQEEVPKNIQDYSLKRHNGPA